MNIFKIFKNNKNNVKNKSMTLEEKWNKDMVIINDPECKIETGESQCYNCKYMNKSNVFKCEKINEITKDILFGELTYSPT